MKTKKVLVTGAAGFIGYHLASSLVNSGTTVVGLDNMDPYYDVNLKLGRLEKLGVSPKEKGLQRLVLSMKYHGFRFMQADICDHSTLETLFATERFSHVCHLAAQAGVRHSLRDPHKYIQSNVVGFMNILECCRNHKIEHLVYASSSSVYGMNEKVPFSTRDNVDHPISIYAATKKSNELMAHCYSHLYGLPTTGLRFFTVYGPWGRPDMALFLFTDAILKGKPIEIYNNGDMVRDFTYVDDVVEATTRILGHVPQPARNWDAKHPEVDISSAPYRVYNIGNNRPVQLMDFVQALEEELGRKAEIRFLPLQPGDVPATAADVQPLEQEVGFRPSTSVEEGIRKFVIWYRDFFRT